MRPHDDWEYLYFISVMVGRAIALAVDGCTVYCDVGCGTACRLGTGCYYDIVFKGAYHLACPALNSMQQALTGLIHSDAVHVVYDVTAMGRQLFIFRGKALCI
jgi:hypothetical protein